MSLFLHAQLCLYLYSLCPTPQPFPSPSLHPQLQQLLAYCRSLVESCSPSSKAHAKRLEPHPYASPLLYARNNPCFEHDARIPHHPISAPTSPIGRKVSSGHQQRRSTVLEAVDVAVRPEQERQVAGLAMPMAVSLRQVLQSAGVPRGVVRGIVA